MKENLILDVDGVLLDFETPFMEYMISKEYGSLHPNWKSFIDLPQRFHYSFRYSDIVNLIEHFCESCHIGFLEPIPDAFINLKKIIDNSIFEKIIIATSLSSVKNAQNLRKMNLQNIFGDLMNNVEFHFFETNGSKEEVFKKYAKNAIFVDDHPKNIDKALEYGIQCILFEHEYNKDYKKPLVEKCDNWNDLHNILWKKKYGKIGPIGGIKVTSDNNIKSLLNRI